jgi:tetratricopeptide (TPR) repeat protein
MRALFGAIAIFAFVACIRAQEAPADNPLQQARQLEETNQLAKANELLSDFVRQNPGNDTALLELGRIQFAQGLNDDALKSFEVVLSNHPDSSPARDGEVKAATAAALVDRKIGLDGAALIYLIRARKLVPDSPELLFDFGMQADSMRIYRDADEALTKAHELAPDDAKILYALAHVEFDEQKMPEAESNMRAYLKMRPDDATAHFGLGRLLHMLTRNDEAKPELVQSIALQPRQTESYYELGQIALEENGDAEAKKYYDRVLSLAPRHGGALTGMGVLAFRKKDYAAAETYLKSAVLYAADYPTAHHYYALVLARLGRPDEAKRESDLATKLNEEETKTSRGNFLTIIR